MLITTRCSKCGAETARGNLYAITMEYPQRNQWGVYETVSQKDRLCHPCSLKLVHKYFKARNKYGG